MKNPMLYLIGNDRTKSSNHYTSNFIFFLFVRVSLIFGIITVITGLLGVIIGAVMGAKLRPKFPTADPLICGFGVLAAVPLIYLMMLLARGPTGPTYATFFFGQWLVNLNWSLATEMIMVNLIDNSRLKFV